MSSDMGNPFGDGQLEFEPNLEAGPRAELLFRYRKVGEAIKLLENVAGIEEEDAQEAA